MNQMGQHKEKEVIECREEENLLDYKTRVENRISLGHIFKDIFFPFMLYHRKINVLISLNTNQRFHID